MAPGRDLLDAYHTAYPPTFFLGNPAPTLAQLTEAEERVAEMRSVAQMWIDEHTRSTTSGETVTDGSRKGRRTGMEAFIDSCNGELVMLRQLAEVKTGAAVTTDHDVSAVTITNPSERFSKVKAKDADSDLTSTFRHLGKLVDMAAPLDGDAAKIAIEVKVPIPPGYVGLEMAPRSRGTVATSPSR